MQSRIWRNALLATAMLILLAGFGFYEMARAEGEQAPAAAGTPKANWPETTYEFGTLMEGAEVTHDFVVENKGQAPLQINKVQPD
ncbi:MAG: DUF1573 domain-containing protein [Desulfobacterales bacterium]|nr:DUF1573 domain-containing protein [Desulfobacterales bacterium]